MKINSVKDYENRIKKVLISQQEIQEGIKRAGVFVNSLYDGSPILLVSVLKGSFVFAADLARQVTVPCEVGFMCVKSYFEGTSSSGRVNIVMDLDRDISAYHVVVAEDIIDTGRTIKALVEILKGRDPLSLHVITLLDKVDRRVVDIKADMSLFEIPDYFVVGYGLDCAEYYRTLPYIAQYSEEKE